MKSFYIPLLFLLVFVSCAEQKTDLNSISIKGNIKNLSEGKVYLTTKGGWDRYLDSAIIVNGRFSFSVPVDSSFVPTLVGIKVLGKSGSNNIQPLFFRTIQSSKDKNTSTQNFFYLEKDSITISGDNNDPFLFVSAGNETELFFKYNNYRFEEIEDYLEPAERRLKMDTIKQFVKKHADSYYIFQKIENRKQLFSPTELDEILKTFDTNIQKCSLSISLKKYIEHRLDDSIPIPNYRLLTKDNHQEEIFDTGSNQLNMIVFWASWCGPCRKEIPELKKTISSFKTKRLHIVSISIDDNINDWKVALQKEKNAMATVYYQRKQ